MIITQSALQSLRTGFHSNFKSGYTAAPTFYNKFTTTVPSSTLIETYGWMTQLASLREWIGPRLVSNLNEASYTLTNKKFELTYGVGRDEIEDETLGIYSTLFQDMGDSAKRWPDQIVKTALQAGTSATTFDGVAFFAATHPLNPAGNQSNNFTGTALSAANYATTRAAMAAYTGADGEVMGVQPNLLIVPPQLEATARTILNAELIGGGDTNVWRNSAELLVIPQLANAATTWYLADVSRPIKPLIFQQRKAPEFASRTDIDSDNVFHQDKFEFGVNSRGAAGYSLWFLMARCIA
jgi:phage major head subunit gpT-like protein